MFTKFRTALAALIAPAKPANAPAPVNLGNGFTFETRDEFSHLVGQLNLPVGGFISVTCDGREVARLDANGFHNF